MNYDSLKIKINKMIEDDDRCGLYKLKEVLINNRNKISHRDKFSIPIKFDVYINYINTVLDCKKDGIDIRDYEVP